VPAIFFWPGHTDPALGANTLAEGAVVRVAMPRTVRIKSAFGDFVGEKCAHLLPQGIAFARQTNLIEIANSCSSRRDHWPELVRTLLSNVPTKLGGPNSFRYQSRRAKLVCAV